jgi:hypothetical protein
MRVAMRVVVMGVVLVLPVSSYATNVDDDKDGWTEEQGDCCDVPSMSCPNPELVNPGAFEIAGNGIDDNCDGETDTPRAVCDVPLLSNASDPLHYAQAIDLCQTTTETPPIAERTWGLISAQLVLTDGTGSPSTVSRSIRPSFGSANSPQFGTKMALLSSGRAAAPAQTNPSHQNFQTGAALGTAAAFPADWLAANGNDLPTVGCPAPQGSSAQDPVMLKLRIRVPTNARSFSVSTRFFSAEYPEYVCSPFVDYFVVLLTSGYAGSPANPNDGNIGAVTADDGNIFPIGTGLAFANLGPFQACKNGVTGCAGGAVMGNTVTCTAPGDLAQTGFDPLNPAPKFSNEPGFCGTNNQLGGGTAWLTTRGNVVPGETIELRLAIWDTGDGFYDSLTLLDNFEWSTTPIAAGAFISSETPPSTAPLPPAGVTATALGTTSVSLEWNPSLSATAYQIYRRGPGGPFIFVGASTTPSFIDMTAEADTSYLYRVRALNDGAASLDSAADLATTVVFTDDPLEAGVVVKAAHLTQLRAGTNAVRALAGLPPAAFTDTASAGVVVKAVHISETRAQLNEALLALGFPAGVYTDSNLTGALIKAAHFQEVRDRIR